MRRSIACGFVCVLAALAAACNNGTKVTSPTPTIVTETFAGILTPNGAVTHTFTTQTAGPIQAALTAVAPDATKSIGFSMGTYNTTTNVCQIVLDNQIALPGALLQGNGSTAATYCIRVYDTGNVTSDVEFSYGLTVAHP